MKRIFASLFILIALTGSLFAQEEAARSSLISFVENKLSAPNRQIRLNGIQGTLSSNVSFTSITISDDEGVWLTIVEPQLIWNRSALLLGRLEVERLAAKSIQMPRGPISDASAPAPEASGFELPKLPVSVTLSALDIPKISFGNPVFGLKSEMSLAGSLKLANSTLDTKLDIVRLDGPGGNLKFEANYGGRDKRLKLDAILDEPENGIIANLLGLRGKPPVSLTVNADAPISELEGTLTFAVDGRNILDGNLAINDDEQGRHIIANLGGPLASIMPENYQTLLGDSSRLSATVLMQNNGATAIDALTLDSGTIQLSANAKLLADGFLSALNLQAKVNDPSGDAITLPRAGAPTTFENAALNVRYDAQVSDEFLQTLTISALKSDEFAIDDIAINTTGTIANFADAIAREINFSIDGKIAGIAAKDQAVAEAIGSNIALSSIGSWKSGAPLQFAKLNIEGKDYALRSNGQLKNYVFDGQIGVEAADLNSFSALADRSLGGSLGLLATGQISPLSGAFNLNLSGAGNALRTDIAALDVLLDGSTGLSGNVLRDENGLDFEKFRVTNEQTDIVLNGRYASTLADLDARIDIKDIAALSDNGTGAVSLTASINGKEQPYDAELALSMPSGRLAGKPVDGLTAAFSGKIDTKSLNGTLSGQGLLDGQAIAIDGQLSRDETQLIISKFLAQIGASRIAVDLNRNNETGLMQGKATLKSLDISSLAALALQQASGAIDAKIDLSENSGKQSASALIDANQLSLDENKIGKAAIKAQIDALLTSPEVNMTIEASDLLLSGVAVRTLKSDVSTTGSEITFDARSDLVEANARVETSGRVIQSQSKQAVTFDTLNLRSNLGNASLAAPTTINIANGNARFNNAKLNVAGGSITLDGMAGDKLALAAKIANLPLSIANAFNASLGLGGTVNGNLDLKGTPKSPTANFTIAGNSVTARQLSDAQISPLSINATGNFNANRALSLNALAITNAQGISVNGTGQIPLEGNGLNFNAEGTAPLNIAELFLADRGAKVTGTARFNVAATGSIKNPSLRGLLSIGAGTFTDPLSNVRITDIGLMAGLSGDTVSIQKLNAQLTRGGSVSATGTIGISGDLPANLAIVLAGSRYSDGQTFTTSINGNLALTGPLLRDPLLSGKINLGETEITVPETFGGDIQLLEVTNIAPDAATQRTLDRITKATPLPTPSSRPSILQLDVQIIAPNRIFVRGRGLDAELGGILTVKGPTTNVRPSGQFELRRGRLSILGQRLDLDEGSVTLTGDLDPQLRFVARSQSADTTAYITLFGRASDLQVSFTSSPELPQDEVLAIIIFGKGISTLSPAQIARLASIAAELTGGNSPGLVDQLRSGLGLDDLDIVQDQDGNAAVKASKYINDNVYLGVQTGQQTEATINLDITDSLTARGAVNSDNETSLGIFFEKDY